MHVHVRIKGLQLLLSIVQRKLCSLITVYISYLRSAPSYPTQLILQKTALLWLSKFPMAPQNTPLTRYIHTLFQHLKVELSTIAEMIPHGMGDVRACALFNDY